MNNLQILIALSINFAKTLQCVRLGIIILQKHTKEDAQCISNTVATQVTHQFIKEALKDESLVTRRAYIRALQS